MVIQHGDRFYGFGVYSRNFPSISIHEYQLLTLGKKQGTALTVGDNERMSKHRFYTDRMGMYAHVDDAEQIQVVLESAAEQWANVSGKSAPSISEFQFFAYRTPVKFEQLA